MENNKDKLKDDLRQNAINIKTIMRSSTDLIIKYAKVGGNDICVIMCEGMVSTSTIAELIYLPLNLIGNEEKLPLEETVNIVQNELLIAGEQKEVTDYEELITGIMSGFVVILFDGLSYGISIGVQGYKSRSIEEPSTRQNIRSSREGFVEVLRTNVSLVRRRMKTPDLVMKIQSVGSLSKTDVCLCYIESKADPELVKSVKKKLDSLKLEIVLEGGYIQPFLEEGSSNLLFAEVGVTEHPDNFIAKLFDGRIGIIVDGTPFALYIPHLFSENFTAMDDYSGKPVYATLMRWLRYFAYFSSVLLPGVYVALANFNPELFPDLLLLTLSISVQTTPFPLLPECLLIHIFYELMREAGLRLPQHVGHAVSIVGGLVIGDIVVSAGLVGAPLVLIVALSAITCFVVPDLYESIVVMRFAFIISGGIWGLYGITIVGMCFVMKICSLNSYGIPHTAPLTPFTFKAMRDTFIRITWKNLVKSDVEIQKLKGVKIKDE